MGDDKSADQKLTFEEAYKRLDEISRQLEDSTTSLEKSFMLFEEGQSLMKHCNDLLDKAERKLKVIQTGESGFVLKEEDID